MTIAGAKKNLQSNLREEPQDNKLKNVIDDLEALLSKIK